MTPTDNALSLDELSCIMNLQRQEAFDDSQNQEDVPKKSPIPANPEETAEETLLKIVTNQALVETTSPNAHRRRSTRQRRGSRQRSRRSIDTEDDVVKSPRRIASAVVPGSKPLVSDRRSEYADPSRKHSSTRRSRRSFESSNMDGNVSGPRRIASAVVPRSKPHGRDRRSEYSDPSRKHSSVRRSRRSFDSRNMDGNSSVSSMRSGQSGQSSGSRTKRHSGNIKKTAPMTVEDGDSSKGSLTSVEGRKASSRQESVSKTRSRVTNSESANDLAEIGGNDSSKDVGIDSETPKVSQEAEANGTTGQRKFEQLWQAENDGTGSSPKKDAVDVVLQGDNSMSDLPSIDSRSMAGDGTKRKTKLEKIHELQGKCDRYKQEWISATRDKKQVRKDLQSAKMEMIRLKKEVDTHVAETEILRKSLSDTLQNLDQVKEEQRQERNEYSNAAKDLAQARIDHAKALNESRELRTDMEKLESTLKERDRDITNLKDDLLHCKDKVDDLYGELDQAENEILKLEDEMKVLEEELVKYRMAADQDAGEHGIRRVRDEMEQKLHEERENRLEEKQLKLEERIKHFEEERERQMEQDRARESELEEQKRQESERQKGLDEERQRMDDGINQRLMELEQDNTALQGRLKSEQLETNLKMKQKDDAIAALQIELAEQKKQLLERDSDPDGVASMKEAVDNAKTDAAAAREDLEEAQKHNGMLEDEIEELQAGTTELKTDVQTLQKELATTKKEADSWKGKTEEWQAKSREWTDKAFLWKEKAEKWEAAAKEGGSATNGEPAPAPAAADPQALFLQAAFQKKQAANTGGTASGRWGLGGLFHKGSFEDDGDAQGRIQELEALNTKQLETIKSLRSEMVQMQTNFKDQAYSNQQKMQEVVKEREAVELKNTNLIKELELARKLESFVSQD